MTIEPIAKIYNGYCDKFGIPRQSGIVSGAVSHIIFEPKYRQREALRGIEGYSHLWLLWHFSESKGGEAFSPTVRPPRLGGNKRVGVFATRSPNRPNRIGLSSVRLGRVIEDAENGCVLEVYGADILSGTEIFDIKPYIPYTDAHADAKGGFADEFADYSLDVEWSDMELCKIQESDRDVVTDILRADPRPSYQNDPERVYTMDYKCYKVSFRVCERTLYVTEVTENNEGVQPI